MIPLFEKAHRLSLTDAEKEILSYFESNLPSSIYANLNDLSASLYTSNATIVRFCQKLGLKGYNEFKYQVRSELMQLQQPVFTGNDLISHSIALFKDNMQCICASPTCDTYVKCFHFFSPYTFLFSFSLPAFVAVIRKYCILIEI